MRASFTLRATTVKSSEDRSYWRGMSLAGGEALSSRQLAKPSTTVNDSLTPAQAEHAAKLRLGGVQRAVPRRQCEPGPASEIPSSPRFPRLTKIRCDRPR